jgi:hypothetical protein
MFAPHGFGLALAMTVLSTICWGSFANTMKLTRLIPRPRPPRRDRLGHRDGL